MITRCEERYGGRWCPVCGVCTCRAREGHDWAPAGADASCVLHGAGAEHPRVKGVAYGGTPRYRHGRKRPTGVQDRNQPTGVQDRFRR